MDKYIPRPLKLPHPTKAAIEHLAHELNLDADELADAIICYSSSVTIASGAHKTEDDMDPSEEGDEKSTN